MNQSRKSFLKKLGLGVSAAYIGTAFKSNLKQALKPVEIKHGDTIGMISPASSLHSDEKYDEIKDKIKRLGFKVKEGAHARDHYGYLAGTDQHRAADLNAMFADKSVDAVMPFRGGWGCDRLLPLIDYATIKKNPKPLIGFSDITTLLLAIYARTGMITYHGPVGKSNFSRFTRNYLRKAVMQTKPYPLINRQQRDHSPAKSIHAGKARGRLLGGNLSVLTSMMGSNYLPSWEGAILFTEDVGEDIYRIDRMLTQLKLNGIFSKINGFIFGRCSECDVSSGHHFTLNQVIADHLRPYEIPVYLGANIGHIQNIFTIPVGVRAEMNAQRGMVRLLEPPIRPKN